MQDRPRILLTGASGFLGRYLLAELRCRGLDVIVVGRRQGQVSLDLEDEAATSSVVWETRPGVILNAAAVSSIAACERDPGGARAVNARAPGILAAASGAWLLQVSTDLVFGGEGAPFRAEDPTCALSEYGRTKAVGERAALAAEGLVVRLALLFGPSGDGRRGATDMIRRALGKGRTLGLYHNEHRTPLHVADAARGLVDLVLTPRRCGVVHLAGPERVSRLELGRRFARRHGLSTDLLESVSCDDPERPRDVSLASEFDPGRSLDEALAAS